MLRVNELIRLEQNTLVSGGEDRKTTLETSGEDVLRVLILLSEINFDQFGISFSEVWTLLKNLLRKIEKITLQTSGKDMKNTLETSGKDSTAQIFRKIAKLIHPDKNSHRLSDRAFKKLNEIYEKLQ